MKTHNALPSFRRRPESRISLKPLDSGLRRNDGNKINGTAVDQHTIKHQQANNHNRPLTQGSNGRSRTDSDMAPEIVHEVLRSPGQALPSKIRNRMEPRFTQELGSVRIHSGTKAADSARAVNALAYTVGRNIVFGKNHSIESRAGQRLLTHELIHVAQQRSNVPTFSEYDTPPRIPIVPAHDPSELEARKNETLTYGKSLPHQARSKCCLQRVGLWENISRFFGGGTFTDEELLDYLKFIDINDYIEDSFDSDNKAREIVQRWQAGDRRYFLPVRRKVLLIQEMLSGYTGDDDENAILTILRQSTDTEMDIIIRDVGASNLNRSFQGRQQDELDELLAAWRHRTQLIDTDEAADETAGGTHPQTTEQGNDYIKRITVNQATTQQVSAHWKSGRLDRDICSTGKGHCCVDQESRNSSACSESGSRASGSNCTPVGMHSVSRKIPITGGGVRLWTEFVSRRSIALHEYRPVDGTPLSHGCVRLNQPMAQIIYDGSIVGRTKVEIKGLARPRCDYPPLQREWAGDFKTAGRTPSDGEAFDRRTQRSINRIRRTLRNEMRLSDAQLDNTIANLNTETGGLPTDIFSSPQSRANTLRRIAPVAALIPRCSNTNDD